MIKKIDSGKLKYVFRKFVFKAPPMFLGFILSVVL